MNDRVQEGEWFTVPLRSGGHAVGVVARASRSGVLGGFFFGPARRQVPDLVELSPLTPGSALLVGRFGHLGITSGEWLRLGCGAGWNRDEWRLPSFVRDEELSGRSVVVTYADDDPNVVLREDRVPDGAHAQGPKDGLMGAGFVEQRLRRLLGSG